MNKHIKHVKRDYIWNTTAGLINASEAVIMSMITIRLTGLLDAGMLTIAFAVGNLMMPIGKFGMRNYQITDVKNRFSFLIYLKTRMVTALMMIISIIVYLGYASVVLEYNADKIGIIFAICMIYVVEVLEDVIWGYYQHQNRLDAGAKMFCIRWGSILAVFFVALYVSRDLRLTLTLCVGVSLAVFLILLKMSFPQICSEEDRAVSVVVRRNDLREIGELLKIAMPLFVNSFLSFYVNNAPKYAIDACLTDEIQACYGFVAMPIMVIRLLNTFIYQPLLVPMAVEWEEKRIKQFYKRILKQMAIIGIIAAICMLGAYLIGIPVLSMLYNTDLAGYKRELIILLLGGAFLAGSGYMGTALTIMRCQKDLAKPYCLVAIIAAVSLKRIVSEYGTIGASVCYLFLMLLLCLQYSIIFVIRLRESRK